LIIFSAFSPVIAGAQYQRDYFDQQYVVEEIIADVRPWWGFGGAIPCSERVEQRHKIIPNGVALVGQESVSGVTGGTAAGANRRTHDAHLHYRQ
jgi:hypothetical protein